MVFDSGVEMSGGFSNIASITAGTIKFINNTRSKTFRKIVFRTKEGTNLKGRENQFYAYTLAVCIN
jgi:hypothetical protein